MVAVMVWGEAAVVGICSVIVQMVFLCISFVVWDLGVFADLLV